MIDLDSLVEERATQMGQDAAAWKKIVWSPEFQKTSSDMSDGEITELLNSCPSAKALQLVLNFVVNHPDRARQNPLFLILAKAKSEQKSVAEWIAEIGGAK